MRNELRTSIPTGNEEQSNQKRGTMKIAVISDLHLGRRDRADRFGHDDTSFVRFLRFLEANFERIVLLGDIFETLTSPRPMAQVEELVAVQRAHLEVAKRFADPRYTYIHGNHDLVAGRILAAPSDLTIQADGVKLLFTHGHGFDWLVRKARWLSEVGVWLGGWLLRAGMAPIFRAFDRLDNQLSGVSADPSECTFQQFAIGAAEKRHADIVVTGHTHVGLRAEHGNRLFLNSGSCSTGKFSYLAIDTKAGQYGVHTSW